jgi:predicted acyl esterase
MGPYVKDLNYLPPGIPFVHREVGNPKYFVPRGYVMVYADSRGTGKSEGYYQFFSSEEQNDFYDVIEWAAKQPWSNENVGLCGVSYYAISQWLVAALQPPHLKCIVPWEGFTDLYRDAVYHGGLLDVGFPSHWWTHIRARQILESPPDIDPRIFSFNMIHQVLTHRLDGPFWWSRSASARFDKIKTPVYSVGNWEGVGLHLRGNLEGYVRVNAPKKLRVHVGYHTAGFYSEEGQMDMLRWYDYWLKGKDTGIMSEPPIKLFIRGPNEYRFENEWPLARTQWTKYYLHEGPANATKSMNDGKLSTDPPGDAKPVTYPTHMPTYVMTAKGKPVITFSTEPLGEDTEVTGPMNLVMWVSSSTKDMDIFARLMDVPPKGHPEQLTRGWLKVSHRKLDPNLSKPWRPVHSHDEEIFLKPEDIVQVHVELWPTCNVFKAGHRIMLDISSHDGIMRDWPHYHYDGVYKLGTNTIYHDSKRPSYLLLPIIPQKSQ